MRFPWGRTITLLALTSAFAFSQPAPTPTCDALLTEQYRQLVTDQVLAAVQGAEMPQQLGAITTQLRAVTLQYYEKVQQVLAVEGQAARQRIELQSLRQQLSAREAELAELRQAK